MDGNVAIIAGVNPRPPYAVHVNTVHPCAVHVAMRALCSVNVEQSFESCDGGGDT